MAVTGSCFQRQLKAPTYVSWLAGFARGGFKTSRGSSLSQLFPNPLEIACSLQLLILPINYLFNYSWQKGLRPTSKARSTSIAPDPDGRAYWDQGLFEAHGNHLQTVRSIPPPSHFHAVPGGPSWHWWGGGEEERKCSGQIITNESEISQGCWDKCFQNGFWSAGGLF